MKKAFLSLFVLLILSAMLLTSCSFDFGSSGGNEQNGDAEDNGTEGGNEAEEEGFIYDKDSELYFITSESASLKYASEIALALDSERSVIVSYAPIDSADHKHEIVFGNSDRAVSKAALQLLSRYDEREESELGFLIYSDGSSVAVVWEDDGEGVIEMLAAEYFIENYVGEGLVAKKGELHSEFIDPIEDYYRVLDEEYMAESWAAFEKVAGKELTDAFKRLYSIYSSDMLVWMANLFDPDICVCVDYYGEEECQNTKYCGTAGFYFSNSARDTVGYLPDVESTNQTLNFLASSGMGYLYDNSYANFLPEEILDKIGDFVYALQEPNGYFYHPQWGIEFTDTKISRRSRDLSWSVSILTNLGRKPRYTTPSGVEGSVESVGGQLTERFGKSAVNAVSKVIMTRGEAYSPQLNDLESFKGYLAGLDITNASYHVGNELTAQSSEIVARDNQIGTPDNPTPLMDYLIEWLNENQNPETGHWDFKKPGDYGYDAYYGVNGLLKISGIYTAAGKVIPNATNAAMSAMRAIVDPEEIDAVVDLYNTWFAIRNILQNLRKCGDADDIEEANEIVSILRAEAVEGVNVSIEKISGFMKSDSSFSYTRMYSSSHAQGCPAAVPNSVEGDVNGHVIATTGIISYALGALDLLEYRVPLFGDADRRVFINTIENLSPITKVEEVTVPDPVTFDDEKVGAPSEEVTLQQYSGGTANVIKDPTGFDMGNVVAIVSNSGGGDYLRMENTVASSLAKTGVFEGDFYVASSDTEYSVQLLMKEIYMLAFKVKDGVVSVKEVSSSSSANGTEEELGISAPVGSWFSLKIEYYPGDHNTVRIKVYADTDLSDGKELKLCAVSDNYFDQLGNKYLKPEGTPSKTFQGLELYVMSAPNLTMYVDNLNCYLTKTAYTPVTDPNNQPFYNVDAPDKDEVLYGFDGEELPSDITVDSGEENISLKGGNLNLSYYGSGDAPSLTLPVNIRTAGSRCASVSFDFTVEDITSGRIKLLGLDGAREIFGIDIVKTSSGIGLSALGIAGEIPFDEVTVKTGEKNTLKLEYYHGEDMIFVYLNGRFVGKSENLFDGGYKLTMDALKISIEGNLGLSLDNAVCERIKKSFDDATKPIVDSKVYDFERADSDVSLSGNAKYSEISSDTVVEIGSSKTGGSVSIPVNNRATLYNVALLEFEISIRNASANGTTHTLNLLDKSGDVILTLAFVRNGTKLELYEYAKDGILPTPLYTYPSSDKVKVTLKMFAENKMLYLYNNGTAVAKTSIFVGEEHLSEPYGEALIKSDAVSSVANIDDVKFETLYEIYENVTVNSKGNGESSLKDPITFEYSNSGNLPTPVGNGIGASSALRVERVEREEEYSNALVFYTAPGTNDFINFTASESLDGYTAVAFETDIMIENFTEGRETCYQIYFSKRNSNDRSYFIQLVKEGDTFTIMDKSDTNNNSQTKSNILKTGIAQGEWFNLRVEYYRGDRDEVRFVIKINGEVVSVSDNFFGSSSVTASPASSVECFYFYTLNKCDGNLYFDNVTMYGFNGECSEGLTTVG